jgi:hypothetical protein
MPTPVPPKFFTPDEANALLPRIEPLMRRLQARRQELRQRGQALDEFRARASRDGGIMPGSDVSQAREESAQLLAEIREGVQQIESWGGVVKDLDQGLVDFPARRKGEQVFLCWRLGEEEIRYWHGLQEGFAGRRPLQDDPVD